MPKRYFEYTGNKQVGKLVKGKNIKCKRVVKATKACKCPQNKTKKGKAKVSSQYLMDKKKLDWNIGKFNKLVGLYMDKNNTKKQSLELAKKHFKVKKPPLRSTNTHDLEKMMHKRSKKKGKKLTVNLKEMTTIKKQIKIL